MAHLFIIYIQFYYVAANNNTEDLFILCRFYLILFSAGLKNLFSACLKKVFKLFCGDKFWVIGSLLINVKKIIFAEIYFDQKLWKLMGYSSIKCYIQSGKSKTFCYHWSCTYVEGLKTLE